MTGQVEVSALDTGLLNFHDAQFDYYGRRLAAATGAPVVPEDSKGLPEGDYAVQIWDVTEGQQKLVGQLKGHDGPVWKVTWAHPKFGSLLATCGFDMKVIIWKEVNGQWQRAYVDTSHSASVNDVEFCPWEHGLRLACGSSDGTVSILTYVVAEARWARGVFTAHAGGVQSLSWAPSTTQRDGQTPQMRLVTGGCDNAVHIWKCDGEVWSQEQPILLPSHTDWVRKVAWRPDGTSTVASGSWDRTVSIWKQEMEGQPWRQVCSITASGKVESVAWSGSVLAICVDNGETTLYREAYDGRFEEVGKCDEQGYVATAPPPQALMQQQAPAAFDIGAPPVVEPAGPVAASLTNELAQAQAAAQASVLESFGM